MLRARELPIRARAALLRGALGSLIRSGVGRRIDLGPGYLMLRGTDLRSDISTFYEIFVRNCYAGSYRGKVIVDLGAHCGYFGAYALLHGARAVYSLEPAAENYRSLEASAASFRLSGFDWYVRRAAVASEEGSVSLFLAPESRAHSLSPTFHPETRGVEQVQAVAFSSVLGEAASRWPDSSFMVKLNIEGGECDIVLESPARVWSHVDEVFLAYHEGVACSLEQLLTRLEAAGLERVGSYQGRVHRLLRDATEGRTTDM